MRFGTVLFLGFSIGVTAAAGGTFVLEVRPYFASGLTVSERLDAIVSGTLLPGPSFDSQRIVLDDCYSTMNSMQVNVSPTSTRVWLLQKCEALALSVTEASPTYAYAWFVAANAAAELGQDAMLSAHLTRSQSLAPREAWLASARVELGEAHFGRLDASAVRGHESDIALLLASARYSDAVVEHYVQNAEFRKRLEAILETLPVRVQTRFVSAAQSLVRDRGIRDPGS